MRHLLNQILINNFVERGYDLHNPLTVQRLRKLHSSDQNVLRLLDDIESAQMLEATFKKSINIGTPLKNKTYSLEEEIKTELRIDKVFSDMNVYKKDNINRILSDSLKLQTSMEHKSSDILTNKFKQLSKDNSDAWE